MTSRKLLATPHSNPTDQASNDLLSTVYYTFLTSTLLSWQPENTFSSSSFAEFIQSVLGDLPSPSSAKSSNAVAFSELLVDLLWAVDVELDDIGTNASATLANADKGNPVVREGVDTVAAVARMALVKQNVEADKQTLSQFVQKLVVSMFLLLRYAIC